jgi:hypothetical protein
MRLRGKGAWRRDSSFHLSQSSLCSFVAGAGAYSSLIDGNYDDSYSITTIFAPAIPPKTYRKPPSTVLRNTNNNYCNTQIPRANCAGSRKIPQNLSASGWRAGCTGLSWPRPGLTLGTKNVAAKFGPG